MAYTGCEVFRVDVAATPRGRAGTCPIHAVSESCYREQNAAVRANCASLRSPRRAVPVSRFVPLFQSHREFEGHSASRRNQRASCVRVGGIDRIARDIYSYREQNGDAEAGLARFEIPHKRL